MTVHQFPDNHKKTRIDKLGTMMETLTEMYSFLDIAYGQINHIESECARIEAIYNQAVADFNEEYESDLEALILTDPSI
jgi:hypothetical protein